MEPYLREKHFPEGRQRRETPSPCPGTSLASCFSQQLPEAEASSLHSLERQVGGEGSKECSWTQCSWACSFLLEPGEEPPNIGHILSPWHPRYPPRCRNSSNC